MGPYLNNSDLEGSSPYHSHSSTEIEHLVNIVRYALSSFDTLFLRIKPGDACLVTLMSKEYSTQLSPKCLLGIQCR
jgi:hypothetical protein